MRCRLLGTILLAAAAIAAGCRHETKLSPEQVAYRFRDVFPYPAVTGDGDDTSRLAPLLDGYLIYVGAKDFPAAAASFERAAKAHPDLVEARLLQGISLVLAERPAEAIGPLESVVREQPDYAPGRWWLGKAYFQAGRHDDAMAQIRQVASAGGLYAKEARAVLGAGAEPN
jgi:tetratricopeptide (TPR) repeat protein